MSAGNWTPREMMAVAAAHEIRAEETILVGLGLPQIAALLAKHTHAPAVSLLFELGAIGPLPSEPAMGVADPRIWRGATAFAGMIDVLGYMLHGGHVTLGILGALQVDSTGSINSSQVMQEDGSVRRFTGSGGANDIASLADRVMVVMRHDGRKFRERVDFITSPGRRVNGHGRSDAGLPGLGTTTIVTDRAVIEVTDGGLTLASVHPGMDPEAVVAQTPLPLATASVRQTAPPTTDELRLIRDHLDPHAWYTA